VLLEGSCAWDALAFHGGGLCSSDLSWHVLLWAGGRDLIRITQGEFSKHTWPRTTTKSESKMEEGKAESMGICK
jgi:hypothetical protein